MLTHWTKKIIVEEGHTIAQLVHILYVAVNRSFLSTFYTIVCLIELVIVRFAGERFSVYAILVIDMVLNCYEHL